MALIRGIGLYLKLSLRPFTVVGCADSVVEVGFEYAVPDHIGLLSGHAFVVPVACTPVSDDGRVIDDADSLSADPFSYASAEHRLSLAVEVRFESMAHCFVEQYSGSSAAHHDGHLSSLGPACGEAVLYASDCLMADFSYQAFRHECGRPFPE